MSPFSPQELALHRSNGHWGDITVYDMFAATAARVPDRIGLVDAPNRGDIFEGEPRRLSYVQMAAEVDQLAESLRSHGIGAGSLVAMQLPNVVELVLSHLAAAKLGAVISPISMAYRHAELTALSRVVQFDAYLSVGAMAGRPFYSERAQALPESITRLGIGSELPAGAHRIDDGVARPLMTAHAAGADDLYAVFWTSGTEGVPKAVPKTHNNMMASSLGAWQLLALDDGANILAPFPFVNAAAIGGLMMCWMRTAGALVLHHPFNLDIFLTQLMEENINYTMVAPTVLNYMRDRSNDPALGPALRRLRAIGTGAAPPDPNLFEFYRETFDVQVMNFFGSNEGAQMCATESQVRDPRQRARHFPRDGDVNWPDGRGRRTANGGEFKLVVRDSGQLATNPGDIGEMLIAGPAVMPGYYSNAGYNRSQFDVDGFFATGDLFEISECGELIRFHARARELIVRGGMKISPVELDNFLADVDGVREVAVAPYADSRMGEKVCVFVVPVTDSQHISLDDIVSFCDDHGLAKFKWPERLVTLEALPRTPLAKLDRKALIRILREDQALF